MSNSYRLTLQNGFSKGKLSQLPGVVFNLSQTRAIVNKSSHDERHHVFLQMI